MTAKEELKLNGTELFQFATFSDWVNNAKKRFKNHNLKAIICVASDNSVCHIGEDFMLARDYDLFPIKAYSLERTKDTVPF